jgi:hypothetical protein
MVNYVVALVFCLVSLTQAAEQFYLVETSGSSRAFNMSTLEITFQGGTLITNQGYSVAIPSLRDGTFQDVVTVNRPAASTELAKPSLLFLEGIISYNHSYGGDVSIQVFNSQGRLVKTLFKGNIPNGQTKTFNLNVSQGMFYIHLRTTKNSETYTYRK